MNFIFKSKQRTPGELVRNVRDAVARLEAAGGASGNAGSAEGRRKVSGVLAFWACAR
jgi:hypothetical protein